MRHPVEQPNLKKNIFLNLGTDAESESSNDGGDDLDPEDIEFDEEALMLPKRSSGFKSSSIISGFERARLSPSHFPTLLEEQLLIYKRPGSVESLESFDPVNSVSDHVMSGAEAASKAEATFEDGKYRVLQCKKWS